MADESQGREGRGERRDLGGGAVGAAIIDVDDLVGGDAIQRGADLGDQRRDVLGFVLDGDDDREVHERAALLLPEGGRRGVAHFIVRANFRSADCWRG